MTLSYAYSSMRRMAQYGVDMDDDEAVKFWKAALKEAEKVVREHGKALALAEKPGCVLLVGVA